MPRSMNNRREKRTLRKKNKKDLKNRLTRTKKNKNKKQNKNKKTQKKKRRLNLQWGNVEPIMARGLTHEEDVIEYLPSTKVIGVPHLKALH